jgi:DNA-binding NarL/FixJ family response regulator
MKVLLVDDSALVRERLREMISNVEGVETIVEAHNGLEAMSCVRKMDPDVVILAIQTPKKSGIDVLQEIKRDKPSCKIMVLTNYPYREYRKKCMELGADFFFDKSTEFDKIPEVLKWLISG